MRALMGTLALLFALTVAAVVLQAKRLHDAHDRGRSVTEPVDIAIVMGSRTDPDGIPSYSSRRRVAVAVSLLESGKAERLLFTGTSNRRTASEASAMRDHAVRLGADPARLLVETKALSTLDNLRFTLEMEEVAGARRIALVTDNFHMTRTLALARYVGFPPVELVTVEGVRFEPKVYLAWMILREALAWWLNVGKVAALEGLRLAGVPEARRRELIR